MNPGEPLSRSEAEDAELGEALHLRLSQLAARLQRLTAGGETADATTTPAREAQRAADVFAAAAAERVRSPGPPRPREPASPPRGDTASLAEIAAALRDLDRQAAPPAPAEPRPQEAADRRAAENRLRSIRQRIDALKARHGGFDPVPAQKSMEAPTPAVAGSRSPPLVPADSQATPRQRRIADFNAAIAEITARQRVIDEAAPAPAVTSPPAADPALATTLVQLQRRVEELSRFTAPSSPPPASVAPPRTAGGDAAMASLAGQLDDIRRHLRSVPERTADHAIESGQAAIIDRLDKLLARESERNIDEIAQELLHRVPSSERFDALVAEIDRLSERIATVDHRPELQRLEARLNQVSERFESVLAGAPRANVVTDLVRRLETIAARSETAPAALEALASEIAGLRARERSELASLDAHIQALALRLDESLAGQSHGGAAMADFEGRLASLARRLDDLASTEPSADRLAELALVEDQIAQLSARIDQIDVAGHAPEALAQLEAQVASLQSRLELLSSDHETLHRVQDNLSRLEALVIDTDLQSLDTVRQAARDAVRELSDLGGSQDSATVEALKGDLRTLQDAARASGSQTAETLDTVHATLDRVVARLNSLESEVRSQPPAAPSETARAPAPLPPQEPARPLSGSREAAPRPPEDRVSPDTPLVPGSPRPQGVGGDRDRRADFIAAARRAAQAAAAEHNAIRRTAVVENIEEEPPPGSSAFARLRRLVSDHRRPLLIAAGAIVLVIAVIQVLKPFDRGGEPPEEPAVVEPAPPATEQPAPAGATLTPTAAAPIASATPDPPPASPGPAVFIPPAGVTSPQIAPPPVAAAPATQVYPMPAERVGSARLRIAAAAGDPAALYEVGARYAEGRGVDRNLAEAAVWLERAAEEGLAVAQHRLATLYEAGLGVAENRPVAFEWYLAAAEQGNVLAMHNLGVMLSQGVDGAPDFAEAVAWFTAAADHGIRDSQYNLGVIFARGIGVEPDLLAAYKWFALAAAQGDTDAAARRDDVAAALTPEQLAAARAAVSAWTIAGAAAEANTVTEPEGGWDGPEERVELLDRDDLVRTIQTLLAQRGFNPGPADGLEGPQTRQAVRAFQETVGLPATGIIDQTLLEVLADRAV